ncbi:hypothetical protein Tco_1412766 [Tanacetum coccineum]
MLSSTRVKCSTSNCISKPPGNKTNDRILQTPSKNKKNKVEAQPRKVNKINRVVKPVSDVDIKFTSTNVVSPKQTTSHADDIQKPELKVYSRKLKHVKNIGSSKKAKIVESKNANHSEPNQTWGSNAIDIPSSSSLFMIGCPDCTLVSGLQMFETHDKESLSAHKLWKSKKTSHQPKAEDTNQEKLYLLHMDLCGPMRAASINGKRTRLHNMTPATPSTGLVSNPVSQQPCIPPIRDDWDRLFQPMFDEYFNPPPIVVSPVQEAPAPRAEVLVDSPFEESPKTPTFHDDPLNESPNEDSNSHGSSSNVRKIHTPFEHLGRWTKDHTIAKVISDPSRFVSTRKQLKTDVMWCYFDAFLTFVEPKNFKQAMTEPSWIDEMQEEIHEFKRLEVWELVLCLDNVFLIKLKWIYKVKTDELVGY